MAFQTKMLSTLEYGKITEMLAAFAATDGAKARARSLLPSDDYDTVLDRQKKTEDARRLVNPLHENTAKQTVRAVQMGRTYQINRLHPGIVYRFCFYVHGVSFPDD